MIKRVKARKRRLLDAAETRKMLRIDADTLDYLQRSGARRYCRLRVAALV
jgi:hypothetical protein